MAQLFESGLIVDLILLLIAVETAALVLLRRATGHGPEAAGIVANALAGGAVMAALRVALTGGWWGWIALLLTLSLFAHAADVWRRWT